MRPIEVAGASAAVATGQNAWQAVQTEAVSATLEQTPRTTPVYLVATDDGRSPAFAASLARGLQLAREAGARVVLYDHSAESFFVDPFEREGYQPARCDHLLEPDELRAHGYDRLADQLIAARQAGLDAGAWLPFGMGAPALARCCAKLGVTRVVLPATAARPSPRERLYRHTLVAFTRRLPAVEFVLVPASAGTGDDQG